MMVRASFRLTLPTAPLLCNKSVQVQTYVASVTKQYNFEMAKRRWWFMARTVNMGLMES